MTWSRLLLMDFTRGTSSLSSPSVQGRGLYTLLNALATWSTSVPIFAGQEGLKRFNIHHLGMERDWLVRYFTHGHCIHLCPVVAGR